MKMDKDSNHAFAFLFAQTFRSASITDTTFETGQREGIEWMEGLRKDEVELKLKQKHKTFTDLYGANIFRPSRPGCAEQESLALRARLSC